MSKKDHIEQIHEYVQSFLENVFNLIIDTEEYLSDADTAKQSRYSLAVMVGEDKYFKVNAVLVTYKDQCIIDTDDIEECTVDEYIDIMNGKKEENYNVIGFAVN